MGAQRSGSPAPKIPSIPAAESAAVVDPLAAAQSRAEEASLSQNASPEELEREAARLEHGRHQRFRHHFENIAIGGLWAASAMVLFVSAVWIWHLVGPAWGRWLSQEDVSHLQSIVTAGLLVGVIGDHFKKRMG